jgi:hypothetical protein
MIVPEKPHVDLNEPPPILRTWGRLYTFVLCYLAALILAFWFFTRHYRP